MAYHLNLDKTGREIGTHGSWGFPVSGGRSYSDIASYEGGRFECHFHPATELTSIFSGEMYYQANDRVFLLREGDAVFVNAEVMHAGWQKDGGHCIYLPLNFSTVMVSGHENSRIEEQYVLPLLRGDLLPYAVFRRERPEDQGMLARIERLRCLLYERREGYELLVKAELCYFWYDLYMSAKDREELSRDHNAEAVKRAITLMEAQYTEHLMLADLAGACGLSRSEFCRTFHKYTGRTPFSYLQHLRVRRSLPLLVDLDLSVTEVAARSGFSGASYYAEIFRRYFGMSPLEYRKKHRD